MVYIGIMSKQSIDAGLMYYCIMDLSLVKFSAGHKGKKDIQTGYHGNVTDTVTGEGIFSG
jgi:hypothetical protein